MNILFIESFETDGNGTRYTTSIPEFTDGTSDFLTRTDGSNISGAYQVLNPEGSFYFAAQDINGEGAASEQTLTFSGINITDFTHLNFSVLLAEDDKGSDQNWDAGDFVKFEYQIDGGGFTNLLAIENDGNTFNSAPFQDTDFDGTGDGTEVTSTFTTFSTAIAQTGSTLDLRITFDLNGGDEDIAIDNIQITGDVAVTVTMEDDVLSGTAGDDRIKALAGHDSLAGQDGNDRLAGNAGNDTLTGGAGDDRLIAGSGDDVLNGTDEISLGVGERDVLGGKSKLGSNTFILGDTDNAYYIGNGNADKAIILNFEPGIDTIELPGAIGDYHLDFNATKFRATIRDSATDDLIAVVRGATTGLTETDFTFV